MGNSNSARITNGQWLALAAALLGWMFDGLEMGLFPVVARPALLNLLGDSSEGQISLWFSVATAGFLVGAATGGVLFGWLADRMGRVRAMMLSVLVYALFSGACGIATAAWQIAVLRFVAALGMGGEWAIGVALVMEIWPDRSRALLAGLIGAVANFGYLLIALLSRQLGLVLAEASHGLSWIGLPDDWVSFLVANSGWRLLMLSGAAPALLTFFIRVFVPESKRWQEERRRGTTSNWATGDLVGVGIGALAAGVMIYLWADESISWGIRLAGSVVALAAITWGYLHPVVRYLGRSGAGPADAESSGQTLGRMVLGAGLGGVALLGTWASIQWAPVWADQLASGVAEAKSSTQMCSALGAMVGTIVAALVSGWIGRRVTYSVLCVGSLAAALHFFQQREYGPTFLVSVFVAGAFTASFYGWLPLYLPELFRTAMRATGQGFSFNFGRILAAVGTLQTGNLVSFFERNHPGEGYPRACSVMSLIYVVGLALIWFAPETRQLPD
jgi:MFS transporter, SHS family, sialic acid transporter